MSRNPEQSFFEDGIFSVPEREAGANILMGIAEPPNAVLALSC